MYVASSGLRIKPFVPCSCCQVQHRARIAPEVPSEEFYLDMDIDLGELFCKHDIRASTS